MKPLPALALGALLAAPALAMEHNTPPDFEYACNANGAVITMPGRPVIYMGKDCDTFSPGVGTGRWWLSASAFHVEIEGMGIRFGGMDPPCGLGYCAYPD